MKFFVIHSSDFGENPEIRYFDSLENAIETLMKENLSSSPHYPGAGFTGEIIVSHLKTKDACEDFRKKYEGIKYKLEIYDYWRE